MVENKEQQNKSLEDSRFDVRSVRGTISRYTLFNVQTEEPKFFAELMHALGVVDWFTIGTDCVWTNKRVLSRLRGRRKDRKKGKRSRPRPQYVETLIKEHERKMIFHGKRLEDDPISPRVKEFFKNLGLANTEKITWDRIRELGIIPVLSQQTLIERMQPKNEKPRITTFEEMRKQTYEAIEDEGLKAAYPNDESRKRYALSTTYARIDAHFHEQAKIWISDVAKELGIELTTKKTIQLTQKEIETQKKLLTYEDDKPYDASMIRQDMDDGKHEFCELCLDIDDDYIINTGWYERFNGMDSNSSKEWHYDFMHGMDESKRKKAEEVVSNYYGN